MPLPDKINSTETMRFLQGGNVGIGLNNPHARLNVAGDAIFRGFENDIDNINAKISISDISGKTVFTKRNIESNLLDVDISDLRNGLYILNVTTDRQFITKKIIKQ